MSSDDSEHEPENHAEDERHQWMNRDVRRLLGEFVLLGLFVVFDVIEVWPTNHILALLGGVTGVSALAFMELSTSLWVACSAAAVLGAFAIFVYAPAPIPFLPPETEIHGWITPANDPTPHNGCGTAVPADGLLMVFGTNGVIGTGNGRLVPGRVGSCPILTLTRDARGLSIDADAYDAAGNLIYRIEGNEFHLVPGQYSYSKRPDRHTLVVYNRRGNEQFFVRFLNGQAVRVRGVFSCSDSAPVSIGNDVIMGNTITDFCADIRAGGTGTGVQIN